MVSLYGQPIVGPPGVTFRQRVKAAAELLDLTDPGWWRDDPEELIASVKEVKLRPLWAAEAKARLERDLEAARTQRDEAQAKLNELSDQYMACERAVRDGETNRLTET